jgi:hypothetical protein
VVVLTRRCAARGAESAGNAVSDDRSGDLNMTAAEALPKVLQGQASGRRDDELQSRRVGAEGIHATSCHLLAWSLTPDLPHSGGGQIGHKFTERIHGVVAVANSSCLLNAAQDLSRGRSVGDILHMIALNAVQASRKPNRPEPIPRCCRFCAELTAGGWHVSENAHGGRRWSTLSTQSPQEEPC